MRRLADQGGLNPTMWNAEEEGGPRNGVMTALDDFVAEHDQPLRVVVLPIYFGLAIVVEEARLDEQPELRAALDRLEGARAATTSSRSPSRRASGPCSSSTTCPSREVAGSTGPALVTSRC